MKQFLKFLPILLLYFVAAGRGYAQLQGQPLIDSLLKELPKQKEDTNKVKLLNDMAFEYLEINPDEAIKYGQQCLYQASKLDWKKGIGMANNCIGMSYLNKSDYAKSLEYFQKALNVFEEIENKSWIANVTSNMGIVYRNQSEYAKALDCYFKALKADEERGNKDGIVNVTVNIGNVYLLQNDYSKALEYYFKALKMVEEIGDKNEIIGVTASIGGAYSQEKNYTMAIEYMQQSLKLADETGNKYAIVVNSSNIGEIYTNQKNYTKAIEYFESALKVAEEMGRKSLVANLLGNIGELYLSIIGDTTSKATEKRTTVTGIDELSVSKHHPNASLPVGNAALLHEAFDHLQRGLAMAKEIKDPNSIMDIYEGLAKAYKLSGDYKKALEATDNYQAIKDSVFSKDNNEKILKMGMKNEYDRQRLTDSLKNSEKEKITALQLQRQRGYTAMGIAGILLLVGFSFFIVRERGKSEKERKKSDGLLLNILPGEVADELKANGTTTAKHYDNVTVIFTDFVNFTSAGARMSPQALIDELHTCFKIFDEITGKYGIEKIKTIGDAYLAVAGLPRDDPKHAENVIRAAIEINAFMQDRLAKLGSSTFEIRIGIHSGSVVAGIVGVKKFAYDIWGDTVNTAARMEQNSEAGKINISATTYELVKDKFTCEYRGEIDAKGKGMLKMYYVS